MRLFAAVVPPAEALDHLEGFLDARRDVASDLRWAPPEQWHLTLAFCGDFPEHGLDQLEERLARAAGKRHRTEARLAGGGAFPNVGRARVLWMGIDSDRTEIERMAMGARAAIAKAGGAVDGQRFRAHLTLARLGRPAEVTKWVRLFDGYAGPAWTIESIQLIASHLGAGERGRPRYDTLGTYPLAP